MAYPNRDGDVSPNPSSEIISRNNLNNPEEACCKNTLLTSSLSVYAQYVSSKYVGGLLFGGEYSQPLALFSK